MLLWSLRHHYLGLAGDARLYAVQALARVHPNLLRDLYLQNNSQDSYTVFSALYAPCIRLIGLGSAALALTLVFKFLFFGASWVLARRLFDGPCAFLAVAALILLPGNYGAFGIFQYAEDWLTARSAAEALVVTAIACFLSGYRLAGLAIASGAMLVHPLMALPGLTWLVCLWLPLRASALGAASGTLLVLAVTLLASWKPLIAHVLVVMDDIWLEVVRERSQFLLLQLWRGSDWILNARPFLSLSLSVLTIDDALARKAGATAILIGAAGLMIASIASLVGPVGIFVQGQAWRWVWITSLAGMLLLVPTLRALCRADGCSALCVLLVICGWTFSATLGTISLGLALVLWVMRDFVSHRVANHLDRMVASLKSLSLAVLGVFSLSIRDRRQTIALSLVMAALVAACLYRLPRTLRDETGVGAPADVDAYSDWRRAIPPDANVLIAPVRNSAAFAWFTLHRPSYLTLDQSSGVVFSRETALEIKRRSQVLLPLMDPDWRLLSGTSANVGGKLAPSIRPLTRERLISVCQDPQLNFVVATENVGFGPLRHARPGGHDWFLYDCGIVNDISPAA
jgi:hypothetical protein